MRANDCAAGHSFGLANELSCERRSAAEAPLVSFNSLFGCSTPLGRQTGSHPRLHAALEVTNVRKAHVLEVPGTTSTVGTQRTRRNDQASAVLQLRGTPFLTQFSVSSHWQHAE